MNKYIVSATAKHPIILRGKHYKIGDTIPTELTEKEYEFYKHALDVESVEEAKEFANGGIPKNNNAVFINTDKLPELKFDFTSPEQFKEMYAREYEKLKEYILKENAETLAIVRKEIKSKSEVSTKSVDTSIKPKKPPVKKDTV